MNGAVEASSPAGAHLGPAERERRFWRFAFSMLTGLAPAAFIGGEGGLARMLALAALTLAGWLLSRRSTSLGVWLHLAGCFPLLAASAADPDGTLGRLGLGALSFAPPAALASHALAAYFGYRGAAVALALGAACLALFGLDEQWGFALAQLAASSLVGCFTHRQYLLLDAAQRELAVAALTDPLTGFGNRRALEEAFPRYAALARRRALALVITAWDVDDLKLTNDRQGHAAGDALIVAVAGLLHRAPRTEDALFRVGGDEFVGLHLGMPDGGSFVERVAGEGRRVSGGWAHVPEGTSLAEALALADASLYAAKAARHRGCRFEGEPPPSQPRPDPEPRPASTPWSRRPNGPARQERTT